MSTINDVPFESSTDQWELGLRHDCLRPPGFSGAAAMPVIFFFLVFWRLFPEWVRTRRSRVFLFFFSAMPMSAAALFGFRVGSRIIDPLNTTPLAGCAAWGLGSISLIPVVHWRVRGGSDFGRWRWAVRFAGRCRRSWR